jgi:segregation and condensation protein B
MLKTKIEALLFVSDTPISKEKFVELLAPATEDEITTALNEMKMEYLDPKYSFSLEFVADGYQLRTKADYKELIIKYLEEKPEKLSPQAIDTLAIIAYKQPITKVDVEEIRGVDSYFLLKTLLEKRLVRIVGKKESLGKPLLYGTTDYFLELVGLNSINELPELVGMEASS